MDYSTFLKAYHSHDRQSLNEFITALRPRLIRFLEIHMGASKADAEDCVQQALLSLLRVIKKGAIKKPEKLHTYMLSTCRNIYLNKKKKISEQLFDELPSQHLQHPDQLKRLIENERLEIVEQCIEKLNSDYRLFITFWFNHPTYKAKSIANHFNLSLSSVWTRKHRIIKQLKECFQKKIKK